MCIFGSKETVPCRQEDKKMETMMEMLSPNQREYHVIEEWCTLVNASPLANPISYANRYQHFEELHRRLKEFPEYNLHLPPKHFLSTGLDLFIIQERCKLLDQYLKVTLLDIDVFLALPFRLAIFTFFAFASPKTYN